MKRITRIFIIEAITLYLVSLITSGLVFKNGISSLILTSISLTIATLFVKPIINLLLLPLNLLTFGFFRFLTNAITLFLIDLVLSDFDVTSFFFKGLKTDLIPIPPISLPSGPLTYLAFSFLISFVTSIIYWLVG